MKHLPQFGSAEESAGKYRTACVFCNGELNDQEQARRIASESTLIIAADGGIGNLTGLEMKPHVIVGDMDSLPSGLFDGDNKIARVTYPSQKDKSDTELALEYALDHRCGRVTLLGATGKRLDHTLCNVALVARHPGYVRIVSGTLMLEAAANSTECVLQGPIGSVVSLIDYGASEVHVKTRGLRYSLEGNPLVFPTQGLSNELTESCAHISVISGILLVCHGSDIIFTQRPTNAAIREAIA